MLPINSNISISRFESKHELNPQIFLDVQPYLTKNELDKLPMPKEGNSRNRMRVLESKGLLIRIAEDENQKKHLKFRISRMSLGRDVISQNNFKHLKIPKASLSENYLIEKLLPIIPGGAFATIAYYVQNHQFFDKAVSELTTFLMKITLRDIVGNNGWMARNWPCGVPRYDNVLIYPKTKNEKTVYKIGLIDLEGLYKKQVTKADLIQSVKNVIVLFPFHYELILKTAEKIVSLTKNDEIFLNLCQRSAEKGIRNVYDKHSDFIIENRKLTVNPFLEFLSHPGAQAKLIKEMRNEIRYWHITSSINYKIVSININLFNNEPREYEKLDIAIVKLKFLGGNHEEMLDYCEKNIIYPFLHEVCLIMKNNIDETKNQLPTTNFKMMSNRSLNFRLTPLNESFICFDILDKPYSFTAQELTTKYDKTLVKPVSPEICEMIVKNHLQTGIWNFELIKLMFDLFKKRGFLAEVFNDEKFITILY